MESVIPFRRGVWRPNGGIGEDGGSSIGSIGDWGPVGGTKSRKRPGVVGEVSDPQQWFLITSSREVSFQ